MEINTSGYIVMQLISIDKRRVLFYLITNYLISSYRYPKKETMPRKPLLTHISCSPTSNLPQAYLRLSLYFDNHFNSKSLEQISKVRSRVMPIETGVLAELGIEECIYKPFCIGELTSAIWKTVVYGRGFISLRLKTRSFLF